MQQAATAEGCQYVRMVLCFEEEPTLGWEAETGSDQHGSFTRYCFPRTRAGSLRLPQRFWLGMLKAGLGRCMSFYKQGLDPGILGQISINPQPVPALLEVHSEGDQVWEQLPEGTEVTVDFVYPLSIFPGDDFRTLIEECGQLIGFAPTRGNSGVGRFTVVSVTPMG